MEAIKKLKKQFNSFLFLIYTHISVRMHAHVCMMNWHYIRGGIYRAVLTMNQKIRNFVHVGLIGCNWIPILLKRIPRLKVEGRFAVLQKDMLPMLSRVEKKTSIQKGPTGCR